jgi:hypothetical protein
MFKFRARHLDASCKPHHVLAPRQFCLVVGQSVCLLAPASRLEACMLLVRQEGISRRLRPWWSR